MGHNGNDLRLHLGFPDHHKIEKLARTAGEESIRCLLRLWCWAADNRHKGVLTDMDATDIAVVSKWPGVDADWIAHLMRAALLDGCGTHDEPWALHDWEEHQPFVFNRDKRVNQAKKAASARWDKRYGGDAASNAPSNADSNAPTPTPTPVGGREGVAASAQEGAATNGQQRHWRGRALRRGTSGQVEIELNPGTWVGLLQFDSSLSPRDVWASAEEA